MSNNQDVVIIPTIDYEIFGNGSGDIKKCLLETSEVFINLAEKYNVKLTFFFEAMEYFKFVEFDEILVNNLKYSPGKLISEQLIKIINKNHDIQLHFHPQWIGAELDPSLNTWSVDLQKWRVADLSKDEILDFLTKGKAFLERLLKPYKSNYECIAFRAGAWSIQPEGHVFEALVEAGFIIDSSVAKSQVSKDNLTRYDFTDTPEFNYWYFEQTLNNVMEKGLLELPIYSYKTNMLKNLLKTIHTKIRESVGKTYRPYGSYSTNYWSNLRNVLLANYKSIDLCGNSIKILETEIASCHQTRTLCPIVLIGHSKDLHNIRQLEELFEFISEQNSMTVSEFYQEILIET
jgi:hypothetical protein